MAAPPSTARKPAGRPPKIANPFRWHLVVNRRHRDEGALRAAAAGRDLTDELRALMADYAAGRITPTDTGRDEVAR